MDRKDELDKKLETIAGVTADEAFERISAKITIERSDDLNARLQKIELFNNEQIEAKATNILLSAIHRIGNVMPTSIMTSNVEIPSDDLKGKVIGKEGRNVRAFERATGVDVLILGIGHTGNLSSESVVFLTDLSTALCNAAISSAQ